MHVVHVLRSVVYFVVQFYLSARDNKFHIARNPKVYFVSNFTFLNMHFRIFTFSYVYFPSCLFENR